MNSQVSLMEPESLNYLPAKTLLRLLERSQQASKNHKAFQQTIGEMPGLFREIETLDLDLSFDFHEDYMLLRFAGDGDKLKAAWAVLRRAGYNTPLRPKKGDTEFNTFWNRQGSATIFMMFSSTLCRRVQVGTVMKEVAVYETQCGGEMPEIESESSAPELTVIDGGVDDCPF